MGWLCKNVTKLGFVILLESGTVLCQDVSFFHTVQLRVCLIAVTRFPSVFLEKPCRSQLRPLHHRPCGSVLGRGVRGANSAPASQGQQPAFGHSIPHIPVVKLFPFYQHFRSVHGCHVPFLWKVLREYFTKSVCAFPNMFGPEGL